MTHAPLTYLHHMQFADLPAPVVAQAKRCLLDLIGTGIGGATTPLSAIIRDHVAEDMPGRTPMLFDTRRASVAGAALAGGMTIDALDGHDGYNPAKGHAGCGVLPALLAMSDATGTTDGQDILTALVLGYEYACRLAVALHGSVPDYHTSGAWVAVAVAAIGARLYKLPPDQTRHALGIAEFHGPRSQMMRCIDHPTMLKDGSGWGAMAGVSAVQLARRGFTGAPAITLETPDPVWSDLGQRWLMLEQYFKPIPVCRWAQAPVEALLTLRHHHHLTSRDVAQIHVTTFHESCRLAVNTPRTTEEAQYSTSFPCAIAMVRGDVRPQDLAAENLNAPEVRRLSQSLTMSEDDTANAAFPERRLAKVTLTLSDGTSLTSDWHTPKWDAETPPGDIELQKKFHGIADPMIGSTRANSIKTAIDQLEKDGLGPLTAHLYQPINAETSRARSS